MLEDINAAIQRMWRAGVPLREICKIVNRGRSAVQERVRGMGLPLRENPAKQTWTPERDAELRRLWPDVSLSIADIGARLGCSDKAAAHRARRLLLQIRPKVPVAQPAKTGYVARKKKVIPNWGVPKGDVPRQEPRRARADAFKPLPNCEPIGLMDLGEKSCRWPIDGEEGLLYCGAQKSSKAYCGQHFQLSIGGAA